MFLSYFILFEYLAFFFFVVAVIIIIVVILTVNKFYSYYFIAFFFLEFLWLINNVHLQNDPQLAQAILGNDLDRMQNLLRERHLQRLELRRQKEEELVST